MYGLLGKLAEWWTNGEQLLVQRLTAAGFDCGEGPYQWDDRQKAYDFMHGYIGPRIYIGDSLGAGAAATYPADVPGQVEYAGGFQPSDYDANAVRGKITVARNVIRAHCVSDPVWADTLGLGNAEYTQAPDAKTIVLVTEARSIHPDDWGTAQDLIYNDVIKIAGGP